ncbi:MAG TPA: hypothetical protein ENI67_04805 [Gammaproteobacteria bacterium]|nr:hypothetical protein [Gammaproteobacteria bacterium]
MLDEKRKFYVTASQCHRVMAGFERELAGQGATMPEFESCQSILTWITDCEKKPLVGELKVDGIFATGGEIKEAWDYARSQVTVFSEGMESVAREIAMAEFVDVRDPGAKTFDMERGHIQQGEALDYLSWVLDIEFSATDEPEEFITRGNLGVTPDGIYRKDGKILDCAEVKNPIDTTHMRYLSLIHSQECLLKYAPIYYWQAQCGMHVTGANKYHWLSYHKGFMRHNCCGVYVCVRPNIEHISMLVNRAKRVLARSVVITNEILERIS